MKVSKMCRSLSGPVHMAWVGSEPPPPDILLQMRRPPLCTQIQHVLPGRAMRDICTQAFDCVVVDFRSDFRSARTFLQQARTQKSRVELPIVLVCHQDERDENEQRKRLEAFALGASDCWLGMPPASEWGPRMQVHVELTRHHRQQQMTLRQQQVLVDTDPLTGAFNRRAFRLRLEAELSREKRQGRGLALMLLDIDHFKAINDNHGHPVGDAVLQNLVKLLQRQARNYDSVARLGGEEFALLILDVNREAAGQAAERVRLAVANYAFVPLDTGSVTVSIGIAQGPVHGNDSFDEVFSRADQALYEAKRGGRNQCVLARSDRLRSELRGDKRRRHGGTTVTLAR